MKNKNSRAGAATRNARATGGASFFRHHGVWAIGVRLFRHLSFRSKAICISMAFGVPIVLLSLSFLQTQQAQLDFVRKERAGVRVMTELQPVLAGLLEARNATRAMLGGHDAAAADLQSARSQVDLALQRLLGTEQFDLATLDLQPQLRQVQQAWTTSLAAPRGVDAQGRTVYGPVSEAVVQLLQAVGDNAKLVLDPQLESSYLINAMVLTLPKLAENLGQLWGWSTYGVAQGGLSLPEYRRYAVWDAGVQSGMLTLRGHLARAAHARPALAQRLALAPLDQVDAYRSQVSDPAQLIAAALEPAEAYALGQRSLRQFLALSGGGLAALDELLAEREAQLLDIRSRLAWLTAGFLLLAGYLFHSFFLVMNGGLKEVRRHLLAMMAGDLTTRPDPWGQDEAARLMHTLRDMQQSLCVIVSSVRDGSQTILQASERMAQGARDLSDRAEQSAERLQHSASAMAQISSAVQQTAEHAAQAEGMARDNAAVAQSACIQVSGPNGIMGSMSGIEQTSGRMEDVIGLIDSLAFRTNILALNAAVEAARAGEQGRGFAVVATEVRALAQRSAAASQDIRALIRANLDCVDAGSAEVQVAGATMTRIEQSAHSMQRLLEQIARGAAAQRLGVAEVGESVLQLDALTQQNVGLVEQSVAASAELQDRASALVTGVARFRLPA
ncbi:methyl-accepting chemotaxis protein [Roseateles sp.]|uniref:methyl-accepting chemotaxis protein n=1 Tax=Roseateles sp. TaxID=1971397 RepID=UPI00286A9829|nr:methyl-accepting chemotaxis protein [Roseateles sp.]